MSGTKRTVVLAALAIGMAAIAGAVWPGPRRGHAAPPPPRPVEVAPAVVRVGPGVFQVVAPQPAPAAVPPAVLAARQAKVEKLKERVDFLSKREGAGLMYSHTLWRGQIELGRAELDLVGPGPARVKLLEDLLALLKRAVARGEAKLVEPGGSVGGQAEDSRAFWNEFLTLTTLRYDVEIELETLKASLAAAPCAK